MTATRTLTVRQWARLRVPDALCGNCRHKLMFNDPVEEIHINGIQLHPKLRCPSCADGPVPSDLPPVVEKSIAIPVTPKSFVRFGAAALPFDFRMAAAGVSREPGSDDE